MKSCHKFISYWINIKLIIVFLFLNLEMRLIIIYVIWRKNMQIYNLKNKLEYLEEVAKLEYDEWADNVE